MVTKPEKHKLTCMFFASTPTCGKPVGKDLTPESQVSVQDILQQNQQHEANHVCHFSSAWEGAGASPHVLDSVSPLGPRRR